MLEGFGIDHVGVRGALRGSSQWRSWRDRCVYSLWQVTLKRADEAKGRHTHHGGLGVADCGQ